jgi:flagellar motor protein MotB
MSSDPYANAIIIKTTPIAPIIMKTSDTGANTGVATSGANVSDGRKPLLDASGNPVLDASGNPMYSPSATTSASASAETPANKSDHQKILEKEKIIEDLLRQYTQQQGQTQGQQTQGQQQGQDDAQTQNKAVDFFLKMVKTYFALVLKFGDTVANTVIRMTMPSAIATPIISDTPLNVADLIKTADRVNQVLANPDFKTELGHMFENTSDAVNPQIKMLLNKMADIVMDVAGKTGSKLASTAAISLSAFPPLAVAFDIANLISVGINAATSGIDAVSTAANSGAKVVGAFNSTPSINMDKFMANTTEPVAKGKPPVANKGTTTPVANKGTTTPVANKGVTRKLKGGDINKTEVAKQFIHDIGGDPIITFAEKGANAVQNMKEVFIPTIEEFKKRAIGIVDEYTGDPATFKRSRQHRGGYKLNRTKRAVNRIRKTLQAFKG